MRARGLVVVLALLLSLALVVRAGPTTTPVKLLQDDCGTYECLPGLDAMGVGFDLVLGKSKFVPVVDFTFKQGFLYQNPWNTSRIYAYPDQAAVADFNSYDVVSMTFTDAVQYSNYLADNAGVNMHYGAAFSLSADVQYVAQITEDQGNTYSETHQLFTVYQVELRPADWLTPTGMFKLAVARLPATYDPQIYGEFVQYFGTHYVRQALYGGKAIMKSNVQSSYASSNSPFVTSGNAKLHFSNLKSGGGGSYSYPSPTTEWLSSSSTETELIGGNPFVPLNQWSVWIASIIDAPAQVSYRLESIANLIANAQIKKNVLTYIDAYYRANSHPQPLIEPSLVRLGTCNCYAADDDSNWACQPGYFFIGSEVDGGGLPYGPPVCCQPCYSFGVLNSFMDNSTQAAVVKEEQKIAQKRNNRDTPLPALKPTKPTANFLCGQNPCLPGLSSMGIGMDIINGNMKSQPIFQFTYDTGNIWTNPFTQQNFAYPDQIVVVNSESHDLETYIFDSATEYASYLAWKAGISGGIGSYFSGSVDVQSVSSIFSGNLAKLGITTQLATIYEMTLAPPFLLNFTEVFTSMVNALPETYDQDAYARFVDYFGTHTVGQALYGGEAVMKTAVDQQFFTMYDESYIQAQLNIMYQAFQLGINFWRNHTQSFGEFLNASYSECHLLGGNYADYNINDWTQWVESIGTAPVQVRYKLQEITTFISDPQKQANLAQYINYYIAVNNNTQPPVTPPPPMGSCNARIAPQFGNCNDTGQLVDFFLNMFIDNGIPYFNMPEVCATPCYKASASVYVPTIEECDCYVEAEDASFCTHMGAFVSGYTQVYEDAFGNYYPVAPPVCCTPCYKAFLQPNQY